MYYHITYKPEKQLSSLKGKFKNHCLDDEVFIFMINQTPHRLEFIVLTALYAGFVLDPKKMLCNYLDDCLALLIHEEVVPERTKIREIDKALVLNALQMDLEYMADFEDLLKMSNKFDFDLEELSSEINPDSIEMSNDELWLKKKIKDLNLNANLFIVNPSPNSDVAYIIAHLIQRLNETQHALSTSYYQLYIHDESSFIGLYRLDSRAFLNTVLGKSVLIRMDYSKLFRRNIDALSDQLICQLVQLSKLVPVILLQEIQLSQHLVESLAQRLKASIVVENERSIY